MQTKLETDLIISERDVLVKQRIGIKLESSGPQIVKYHYPLKIRSVKARDKEGPLQAKKIDFNSIQVQINRNLAKGSFYAFEISMLVEAEINKIAQITIYNWGAMDLFRVITLIQPFQVLGFLNFTKKNGNWIFSNNLSKNVSTHISKYRNARVEIGKFLDIFLIIRYRFDCSNGSRIQTFRSFGPVSSDRQETKLLTSGVNMKMHHEGIPQYILSHPVKPGEKKTIDIKWRVKILPQPQITENLGSVKALDIAVKDSPNLKKYISGDTDYWNISHPLIQKIANKTKKYSNIFDVHKFLFEFSNRRIKYQVNSKRISPIEVLKSRIGDCSEYSDLLVTLLRASGIPSRVVEGVIIDNNAPAEGHAWVEFLSTKGWIPSDPTWGLQVGITCQHIEFNRQIQFRETSAFEMEFQGPEPKISYEIIWSSV